DTELLAPPKASREVRGVLYDDDNGKDVSIEYSLMLSKDFVESKTNAGEIDYLAVYAPQCDDEFCAYDLGQADFMISSAPENEIYYMIEEFKHSGVPDGVYSFERVDDMGSRVYFKACAFIRGLVFYFYAIDRGITYNNNYIGISYDEKLRGSALEKKLMGELDEAVRSYKEIAIDTI
ncbi:MAG: hypothetical protein NC203_03455, partial [Firmicutes bacterium]|nr:hypothetical protein [Bacillota bacterium]